MQLSAGIVGGAVVGVVVVVIVVVVLLLVVVVLFVKSKSKPAPRTSGEFFCSLIPRPLFSPPTWPGYEAILFAAIRLPQPLPSFLPSFLFPLSCLLSMTYKSLTPCSV